MTMNDLERYIEAHIAPEDELLRELDRETHLSVVQPRMLSGHMQGRLLEMLVRMLAPKRILEIGTFTGYSAICMAGACLSAASCIRSKWTTSWKRSPRGISPAAASATGFSHISARRSIWLRRSAYST